MSKNKRERTNQEHENKREVQDMIAPQEQADATGILSQLAFYGFLEVNKTNVWCNTTSYAINLYEIIY